MANGQDQAVESAEAQAGRPAAHGAEARWRDLGPRIASGVALGAVASGAIWAGGWWTTALVAAAALFMAWEYRSIVATRHGGFDARDWFFPPLVAAAPIAAHLAESAAVVALGLLLAAGLTYAVDRAQGVKWRWSVPGLLFIAAAAASFVFLRDQPEYGFEATVWLVVVVVATDIGGYFAGRLIGGPKLAPRLSPKKTWAGLAGGGALAALCGSLFSWATTGTYFYEVATVSLAAALVAQAGDLGESAFKRRFGVKDASKLIPGHGGALDRLDGLMAASLVAATVTFARGKEVFIW
ncbi:MAG: phosphatidate cytidylyltransferase [Pseudomonadota bacterium]